MQAIVAADNNWGIGYQNRLLVSIPSDMKFFRQKTTGNVVVMGRKTFADELIITIKIWDERHWKVSQTDFL